MVPDELEVVIHASEQGPGSRRTEALVVVAMEQLGETIDRIVEVHAYRTEHVRGARDGLELTYEAVDAPRDVPAGSPRYRRHDPVPSHDAGVRQHVSLEVRERVPVAEHLGAVVVPPDEVERPKVLLQHLRRRPLQGKGALAPGVGRDEIHAG